MIFCNRSDIFELNQSLKMSNRTRSILKAFAVAIVLLCVLMNLGVVSIPAIAAYTFWMVVVAFGVMLITSR